MQMTLPTNSCVRTSQVFFSKMKCNLIEFHYDATVPTAKEINFNTLKELILSKRTRNERRILPAFRF